MGDIATLCDAELLSLYKSEIAKGMPPAESSAFDEVLRRYERLVFHIAKTYFRSAEDARDACQDVAIKIFGSLHKVRLEEGASLKPWVATVTGRVCIDGLRLRSRRAQTVEFLPEAQAGAAESAEDAVVAKERAEEIVRALKLLPDSHRIILILRDMKGLSYDELSGALGINIGTVKSQLNRARAGLKRLLDGFGQ